MKKYFLLITIVSILALSTPGLFFLLDAFSVFVGPGKSFLSLALFLISIIPLISLFYYVAKLRKRDAINNKKFFFWFSTINSILFLVGICWYLLSVAGMGVL